MRGHTATDQILYRVQVAIREEEVWLQSLSERFSEFGWPARKVFNNFDIDGDDEISWNDFKEAIANEPLKLTGAIYPFVSSTVLFLRFTGGLALTIQLRTDNWRCDTKECVTYDLSIVHPQQALSRSNCLNTGPETPTRILPSLPLSAP